LHTDFEKPIFAATNTNKMAGCMAICFKYNEKEIEHLKRADKKLAEVIDRIGMIERAVNPDLFSALVHSIVGQQISSKAQQTIWERIQKKS
jgi:DNA-3-methyladenine glycosylase II